MATLLRCTYELLSGGAALGDALAALGGASAAPPWIAALQRGAELGFGRGCGRSGLCLFLTVFSYPKCQLPFQLSKGVVAAVDRPPLVLRAARPKNILRGS